MIMVPLCWKNRVCNPNRHDSLILRHFQQNKTIKTMLSCWKCYTGELRNALLCDFLIFAMERSWWSSYLSLLGYILEIKHRRLVSVVIISRDQLFPTSLTFFVTTSKRCNKSCLTNKHIIYFQFSVSIWFFF